MSKLIALLFEEAETGLVAHSTVQSSMGGVQVASAGTVEPGPDIAYAVLKTIRDKAKEANVKLEDAVVVYKTPGGLTRIRQTKELTAGKGATRGVFWGLLAGLILGGPVAGLLWGMGIGAVYGASIDHGIDNKFLRDVADGLMSNRSAVLVMVQDKDAEDAIAYLETFDAEMHVTDLSEEAEMAAQKAAEHEEIAQAVQTEYSIE